MTATKEQPSCPATTLPTSSPERCGGAQLHQRQRGEPGLAPIPRCFIPNMVFSYSRFLSVPSMSQAPVHFALTPALTNDSLSQSLVPELTLGDMVASLAHIAQDAFARHILAEPLQEILKRFSVSQYNVGQSIHLPSALRQTLRLAAGARASLLEQSAANHLCRKHCQITFKLMGRILWIGCSRIEAGPRPAS